MATMENPLIVRVIDAILRAEGGYVNDPQDKGGETNYGITVAVARANGYTGPMRDLTVAVARDIGAQALQRLNAGRIKGKKVTVRRVGEA